MQKVDGINLAATIAAQEAKRQTEGLAAKQARIDRVVRDLLATIETKTSALAERTADVEKRVAAMNDGIDNAQASLITDKRRLEAIKAGDWDALDPNFGQPEMVVGEVSIHELPSLVFNVAGVPSVEQFLAERFNRGNRNAH